MCTGGSPSARLPRVRRARCPCNPHILDWVFSSLRTVDSGRDSRHCYQVPWDWRLARTLSIRRCRLGIQPHLDQYFYDGRLLHFYHRAGVLSISVQACERRQGFCDCQQEKPHEPGNALRWERDGLSDGGLRPDHAARTTSRSRWKTSLRIFVSQRCIFGRHGVWAGSARGFSFFTDAGRHRACAWDTDDGARRNYYGDDDGAAERAEAHTNRVHGVTGKFEGARRRNLSHLPAVADSPVGRHGYSFGYPWVRLEIL